MCIHVAPFNYCLAVLANCRVAGRLGGRNEKSMTKLRVQSFSISLDGYGAGPNQSVDNPLGVGGEELHEWVFETRSVIR